MKKTLTLAALLTLSVAFVAARPTAVPATPAHSTAASLATRISAVARENEELKSLVATLENEVAELQSELAYNQMMSKMLQQLRQEGADQQAAEQAAEAASDDNYRQLMSQVLQHARQRHEAEADAEAAAQTNYETMMQQMLQKIKATPAR